MLQFFWVNRCINPSICSWLTMEVEMLLTYIYHSSTLCVSHLQDISINRDLVMLMNCLQYSFLCILNTHYGWCEINTRVPICFVYYAPIFWIALSASCTDGTVIVCLYAISCVSIRYVKRKLCMLQSKHGLIESVTV